MSQPVRAELPAQPSAAVLGSATVVAELFDAALDAVILMDSSGLISAWNHRAEETFGWPVDDVIGRRLSDLVIPHEQRLRHERGLRRANRDHGRLLGQRLHMTALHRDGHEFPVELTIIALGDGPKRSYAGFVRDLTREEAAEAARSEAEIRYRSLIERLPGIAYVNEIGNGTRFVSPRVTTSSATPPTNGAWTCGASGSSAATGAVSSPRSPAASSRASPSPSPIGFTRATDDGCASGTRRSSSTTPTAADPCMA